VVEPYPSEKCESVGMMTFPTEWENKIHVPNHQPDLVLKHRVLGILGSPILKIKTPFWILKTSPFQN